MGLSGSPVITTQQAVHLWRALTPECQRALMNVFILNARTVAGEGARGDVYIAPGEGVAPRAAAGLMGLGLLAPRRQQPIGNLYAPADQQPLCLTPRGFDVALGVLQAERERLASSDAGRHEERGDPKPGSRGAS